MKRLPKNLQEKIKENPDSGCWQWTGAISNGRFGVVKREKRTWKASRLVYTLLIGPISEGMYLLHSCDNELCVNPAHLRQGTQKDNMSDMYQRKRDRHSPQVGEKNHNAKITAEDVKCILKDERPQTDIGDAYGLSQQTVSDIKRRKIWKHVQEE